MPLEMMENVVTALEEVEEDMGGVVEVLMADLSVQWIGGAAQVLTMAEHAVRSMIGTMDPHMKGKEVQIMVATPGKQGNKLNV